VNDLIFIDNNQRIINKFKQIMKFEFEMTNLWMMRYFLGLEIKQKKSRTFISQGTYARKILQKFRMKDYNPVATPMKLDAKLSKLKEVVDSNNYWSIIGSLRHLTCTRPDIAFVVEVTSRFMEDPRYSHLKVVKRILRYVKEIEDLGLFY
jgi:Reverse transcriptase (RNA-dependent DNA polymerase)